MKTFISYCFVVSRLFAPFVFLLGLFLAIAYVWRPASASAQTPQYNVDERQARALEEIAETLKEMKKCGCK